MSFLALAFNPDDIMRVVNSISDELMILTVALVIALVAIVGISVLKVAQPLKKLVRGTSWIALLVVVVLVVNMIVSGPLYSIVNNALRSTTTSNPTTTEGDGEEEAPAKSLTQASIDKAIEICTDLAAEGIILLENDGILPLKEGTKLNTFGWSASNAVYGGTGSGSLSQDYEIITFLQGLVNAGLDYNTGLIDFYTNFKASRPSVGMMSQDWTIPEPTQAEYEAAGIYDSALAYSDTAIFFVARCGGEGADLPLSYDGPYNAEGMSGASGMSEYADDLDASKHYLELSNREIATLERLNKDYKNIIVIINSANAMELGFLEEYENIRAAVLVPGGPGQTGFNSLGKLLTGAENFSGKTADTYVYDLLAAPSSNNFGSTFYTNVDEFIIDSASNMFSGGADVVPNYVAYTDGIYVGYRFYETAGYVGLINYDETVTYPFGYGLSYTTFEQTLDSLSVSGDTVTATVTVKNTGSVAGKDVVQLYFNPPYTNGGIEKSTANLVAFDKTGVIEPGKTETLTLTWAVEDMTSYDTYGHGCYVLEAGDYIVSLNADSHNIIAEETLSMSEIVYSEGRDSDQVAATNQFGFVENTEQITYLSRKDNFANYAVATASCTFTEMTAAQKAGYYNHNNYDPTKFNNPEDEVPTTGKDSGIMLQDMRGIAYDDLLWDQFLDQLTVEDMVKLISEGGYGSAEIRSIGKTQQIDCDGPASINNNFTREGSIGFTSAVMIASTWNEELAYAFGESIGEMADLMGVSGWYAPAMNTHRSAFAGRNFEYYSEDGLLGGKMAANAVKGAESHGVYSFLKHFALNDQELNRTNLLCTWSNEQAIREIYLKPFELAVKEGGADAVMSSFNYIGYEYAGACDALLNKVLRDEWGFVGMVLTDYFGGYGYQDADIQIRNGGDFCLAPMGGATDILDDQTSGTSLQAARQACKNILYVTANSRAYASDVDLSTPTWQIVIWTISAVIIAGLALVEVKLVQNYMKRTKATA